MIPAERSHLTFRQRIVGQVVVAAASQVSRLSVKRIGFILNILSLGTRNATDSEAADALKTVISTSPRLSMSCRCLERSIAIALLCGLRRRRVLWCVGVRTPPFEAHSWIVAGGVSIGEPTNPADAYSLIFSA